MLQTVSFFISENRDFLTLLATRRNASSPGLNPIPYKVYKKCPQINTFLFNIFKSCLKNCVVPIQWCYAREIFIPKCKTPMESNIKNIHPIALLNVEGKLLFSLVSMYKFINTSVQKGCMEKVPGCWEHMSMVWSALKDARSDKLDLETIWLDIANAYHTVLSFLGWKGMVFLNTGFLSLKTTMLEFIVNRFGTNICVVYLLVVHCP